MQVGSRVRFTDTSGRDRSGVVRDHKKGRLAWQGKASFLVVADDEHGGGIYWTDEVRPDKENDDEEVTRQS